jgi:hypothetical protein
VSDVAVKNKISSSTFEFLQKNVLSITDLTRTNKLSEILNNFSEAETDEVYVVQNHKNKDATGVLVDLEHYIKLLKLAELIEDSVDEQMLQVVMERRDDQADIPLRGVIKDDEDIDYDDIFNKLNEIDLED